jgi:hypothetical protein
MLALRQRDLAGGHTRGLKPRLVAARDFPGANARSGLAPSRHGRVRAPPRPVRPDGPGRARDEADRERATVPARSAAVASALDGAGRDARLAFAREKHATRARSRASARPRALPRAIRPRRSRHARRGGPDAGRDRRTRGGPVGSATLPPTAGPPSRRPADGKDGSSSRPSLPRLLAIQIPRRRNRTSRCASRRSVLARAPGPRGISPGAQTTQSIPAAARRRANTKPIGPAS